jgi:SPP1 gp7 family putative phage head morphogenesis protein
MPPKSEQLQAVRALERHEDGAVKRLLRLLAAARLDLRQRLLLAAPGSATAFVLHGMEVAVASATDSLRGRMLDQFREDAAEAVGLGVRIADAGLGDRLQGVLFHLSPQLLSSLDAYHAGLITALTDELRGKITRAVQIGVLAGRSTPEIARDIGALGIRPTGPFRTARERAETIARTEIARIASLATAQRQQEAARYVPGLMKAWRAHLDDRVRPAHRAANGQQREVGKDFNVGGFAAAHPHDPRLPASLSVNCRCRVVSIVPGGA